MPHKPFHNWKQIRQIGEPRFILLAGVYCWGVLLPMFISVTHSLVFGRVLQLGDIAMISICGLIAGLIWSYLCWHINEEHFQKAYPETKPTRSRLSSKDALLKLLELTRSKYALVYTLIFTPNCALFTLTFVSTTSEVPVELPSALILTVAISIAGFLAGYITWWLHYLPQQKEEDCEKR